MALDTTVGGASANSYATLVELTAYLDARVPTTTLASATTAQQEAAMKAAARLLDKSFDWTGAAVDSTQRLAWPRSGMLSMNGFSISTTEIPEDLKNAQCEFAVMLYASDRLSDVDPLKKGITGIKAGSVSLSYKYIDDSNEEAADVAIRRMDPEFQWASRVVPDSVRQLIPESWYTQHSLKRPFIFGAM